MWKRRPFDGLFCWPRYLDGRDACLRSRSRRRGRSREQDGVDAQRRSPVELAKAPSCRRIVFETGRMAPILFHGLNQLGLPVVCVESRQAYQALKSLATHKTDRNDARGLAHLARTGFFKPVHVKSLARSRAPLVDHRAQEAGRPASDLGKSDPRLGGRVRGPTAPRAHGSLHRSGSSKQARGSLVSLPPCGV